MAIQTDAQGQGSGNLDNRAEAGICTRDAAALLQHATTGSKPAIDGVTGIGHHADFVHGVGENLSGDAEFLVQYSTS